MKSDQRTNGGARDWKGEREGGGDAANRAWKYRYNLYDRIIIVYRAGPKSASPGVGKLAGNMLDCWRRKINPTAYKQ